MISILLKSGFCFYVVCVCNVFHEPSNYDFSLHSSYYLFTRLSIENKYPILMLEVYRMCFVNIKLYCCRSYI